MYQVDEKDWVVELHDVPQSSVGAPLPIVLSDESKVLLAFLLQETPEGWDGTSIKVVDFDSDEPVAIVEFDMCRSFMFGSPNDEAFNGHPLYRRGLHPYGAFEIVDSSWIRSLERMNSVHPNHNKERFERLKHFVFAFHDSTFECVAEGFNVSTFSGSLEKVLPILQKKLFERSLW